MSPVSLVCETCGRPRAYCTCVSEADDTLVEAASTRTLADLFNQGLKQGVLEPTYQYQSAV